MKKVLTSVLVAASLLSASTTSFAINQDCAFLAKFAKKHQHLAGLPLKTISPNHYQIQKQVVDHFEPCLGPIYDTAIIDITCTQESGDGLITGTSHIVDPSSTKPITDSKIMSFNGDQNANIVIHADGKNNPNITATLGY